MSPVVVDAALREAIANGVALNAGQVALVRQMATSGSWLQLAMAPADAGKTTAFVAFELASQLPDLAHGSGTGQLKWALVR